MKDKYDVIVIGTGCGGSAAGALAAYHGHKTLILEKNSMIGGRTATYQREGFKMDHGHVLFRCERGPHGKLLRMIDCHDLAPRYSHAMDWGVQVAVDDKMLKIDPYQRRIFKPLSLGKEVFNFKLEMKELIKIIMFNATVLSMPPQSMEDLYQVDAKTFLNIFTTDKYFHNIFGGVATVCLGAVMNEVSAGVLMRLVRAGVRGIGYPVSGEGISAIPNSFLKAAKRNGAELELKTPVEEIVVENKTVRGVIADGKFIEAAKVISNVGIGETVFNLVGEEKFDREYANGVKNLKYSYQGFSLKYALDKEVTDYPWGGEIPGNMDKITSQMSRGVLPERLPWMYVAASNLDSSIAPEGKQAIYVISGGSPAETGQVEWEVWMKRIKEQVAEFFPGIEKHIVFCEESTPDDIASFSGRICGDSVGVAQTVDQAGNLRPSPVSPIEGLYYVGADVGKDQVGTELATESAIALEPHLSHP